MSARAASSTDTTCPPRFSMAPPSAPDRCAACRQPTSRRWSSGRVGGLFKPSRGVCNAGEALVIRSVRAHLKPSQEIDDRGLVKTHVARVEVQPEQLIIQLAEAPGSDRQTAGSNAALEVSWQQTISRRRRAILVPDGMSPQQA